MHELRFVKNTDFGLRYWNVEGVGTSEGPELCHDYLARVLRINWDKHESFVLRVSDEPRANAKVVVYETDDGCGFWSTPSGARGCPTHYAWLRKHFGHRAQYRLFVTATPSIT